MDVFMKGADGREKELLKAIPEVRAPAVFAFGDAFPSPSYFVLERSWRFFFSSDIP